jgi:hypothetical protein
VRRKRGRRSDVSGAGSGPRPGLWGTRSGDAVWRASG